MTPPPILEISSIRKTDFTPAPLPADWVLEGAPNPRSCPLAKGRGSQFCFGLWECHAGKFNYTFPEDEIIQVLEGEVMIRSQEQEYHLRPGDTAYFPQGLLTTWTVDTYVKKLAVFHSPKHPLLKRVVGKMKRLLGR